MNLSRLSVLLIGCIVAGNFVNEAFGQASVEDAIKQVKAIIHADPIKQNELRAEEAKKIIMARIRTSNPDGKVDENLDQLDGELDKLRNSTISGEDLLKWSWENRVGRCDEQVNLMRKILEANGVKVTPATSTLNHTFLLVNLSPGADPDIPWTWGPNAIAPDSWLGKTLRPEESWKEKWHFDNGKGYVGEAKMPATTRQYLIKLGNSKNPNAIGQDCKVNILRGSVRVTLDYRQMLNNYFMIPEDYRKGLESRPKEDLYIEKSNDEVTGYLRQISELERNSSEYVTETTKIHAKLSDIDGRLLEMSRCCDADALKQLRSRIAGLMRIMPNLRTDADLGVSDVAPDDIIQHSGEVKVDRFFVFLLTNSSNGLYVGSEESLKNRTRCSFIGGGINCKATDVITFKKLLGPFASQDEAQGALCKAITETRHFPLGVGLKGRWQGGNNWYGLWDAGVGGCAAN